MIKLESMKKDRFASYLECNGTREGLVKKALVMVKGRKILAGTDGVYTIVQVGDKVGVSKRCRYGKSKDAWNCNIGFSLAFLRALGLSENGASAE